LHMEMRGIPEKTLIWMWKVKHLMCFIMSIRAVTYKLFSMRMLVNLENVYG
jgi:hypothetical protein